MNKDTLVQILTKAGIPYEKWGTGTAKTSEHLLDEINLGESRLLPDKDTVVRSLTSLAINVFYRGPQGLLVLQEDRQVFVDGRLRSRNLETSLGEKLLPGEDGLVAAKRAIVSELQITGGVEWVKEPDWTKGPVISPSYPGLLTFYQFIAFSVYIPKESFKPEGYVQIEPDKTSYFVWKQKVEPPV